MCWMCGREPYEGKEGNDNGTPRICVHILVQLQTGCAVTREGLGAWDPEGEWWGPEPTAILKAKCKHSILHLSGLSVLGNKYIHI